MQVKAGPLGVLEVVVSDPFHDAHLQPEVVAINVVAVCHGPFEARLDIVQSEVELAHLRAGPFEPVLRPLDCQR